MKGSLNNESQTFVVVPFLVTSENLVDSTFGTNAIEDLSVPYKTNELQHVLPRFQTIYQTIHQKLLIHLLTCCSLRRNLASAQSSNQNNT